MASLRISEFSGLGAGMEGVRSAPITPSLAEQQVTIGTVASSNALNEACRLVRIHAEALCCIKFGTVGGDPTAATTDLRMTAGMTEYFSVIPGSKISVITTT